MVTVFFRTGVTPSVPSVPVDRVDREDSDWQRRDQGPCSSFPLFKEDGSGSCTEVYDFNPLSVEVSHTGSSHLNGGGFHEPLPVWFLSARGARPRDSLHR